MTILYEDNHLIAVSKTCNELVQGDKTGDVCLLDMVKAYIKERYNKPGEVFLGLPHRLDRPTSGVVLLCKTSKALTRMNALFQTHEAIHKTYWAVTANCPQESEGELRHFLQRNEAQNRSYVRSEAEAKRNPKHVKEARLRYRVIGHSDRYHLLEVQLLTGRHHQIRCQLAAIGCPIKGDLKYGAPRSNRDGGISLHARSLSFEHPVSHEMIHIVAPAPEEFNMFLD